MSYEPRLSMSRSNSGRYSSEVCFSLLSDSVHCREQGSQQLCVFVCVLFSMCMWFTAGFFTHAGSG
jgi:hypothetical protein